MPTEQRIHCTIHWQTSESTGQRDLLLPNITVADLTPLLIERLGLQRFVVEPAQGEPTLHYSPDNEPLVATASLSELGVDDGDQLWLVVTPRFVNVLLTVQTVDSTTQVSELLATRVPVQQLIAELLDQHDLHRFVTGPSKSTATLRPAHASTDWADDATLLDIGVGDGDSVWFTITPTRMPIVLHWQEGTDTHSKQIYVPMNATVAEHTAYVVGLLGLDDQLAGPDKSVATLHLNERATALPADVTLSDAGVPFDAPIWLRLISQFAAVTLGWKHNDELYHQEVRLALDEPVKVIAAQLADILDLQPLRVTLHRSESKPAFATTCTLADYGVSAGDQLWLSTQPAQPLVATPMRWWYGVAGVIILLVAVLAFGSLRPEQAPTVVIATQIVPITVIPSSQPPQNAPAEATPTPDDQTRKRLAYTAGREAYDQQNWPLATEQFEQVVAIDPTYLGARDLLITSYNNWAITDLRAPDAIPAARERLQKTLVLSPENQFARDEMQLLSLYEKGRQGRNQQNWEQALASLEQLYASQAGFLDTAALLYDTYLQRGAQLEAAGLGDAAGALYRKAQQIAGVDSAEAASRLTTLTPPTTEPAQPSERPRPTERPIALVIVPDMHYADVGRARQYLGELGFVALPPSTVPSSQIGDLCRGEVSYTSPPAGTRKPKGTRVRIFYRDWNDQLPNPSRCAP